MFAEAQQIILLRCPVSTIQYIDVRDLATWVVKATEKVLTGCFNLVGR